MQHLQQRRPRKRCKLDLFVWFTTPRVSYSSLWCSFHRDEPSLTSGRIANDYCIQIVCTVLQFTSDSLTSDPFHLLCFVKPFPAIAKGMICLSPQPTKSWQVNFVFQEIWTPDLRNTFGFPCPPVSSVSSAGNAGFGRGASWCWTARRISRDDQHGLEGLSNTLPNLMTVSPIYSEI